MLRIFQQRKEHCDGNEASWPAPTAGERRAGPITRPCRLRGHMKHPKAKFPETNGWEFFSLELATALPPDPAPPATMDQGPRRQGGQFPGRDLFELSHPRRPLRLRLRKGPWLRAYPD